MENLDFSSEEIVRIPLTRGEFAIVDAEYAHLLSGRKWHLSGLRSGNSYACCWLTHLHIAGQMHRILYEHINGPIPPGLEIDHIDGNSLNNRLSNLRAVTRRVNAQNKKARREGKTSSKYLGVTWNKHVGKWQAQIQVNYHSHTLGHYDDEYEAHQAYLEAVKRIETTGSF